MKKKLVIDVRESGTSTGRYIDKLIENLHYLKPDLDITLLAKKHRVEFFKNIAPSFTVNVTRFREFTFGEQLGYWWQIRKLKPDLVFFPAVHQPILYRGKVVTTIQDLTTVRFRNPGKNWVVFTAKRWVYIWVNKIVSKKSTLLITPTEFVKEDFARFARVNSRKITVTLESADKIPDKPEPVEALSDKDYIMYLGRPLPHKNLGRLIEAFEKLQKDFPELHLALVGKKDLLYKKYEFNVRRRGVANIHFIGFVSEGQMRWLYENTLVYAFPSLSEGFGLTALEAMAHGAPVASSNATCSPEVNKDGAVYFDPLDVDDIANTIASLLKSPKKRSQLAMQGRKVAGSYSWKRMAEQTLDVFKEALSK